MRTNFKRKSYSELALLDSYEDRLEYLYIGDMVGYETFGQARWLNQRLYKSQEWRRVRDRVIARDEGNDLGVDGCGLHSRHIIVHHINPITEDDILNRNPCLFDEDNLISTSPLSHNHIHYGNKVESLPMDRRINDTCPWKIERR